ncbi:MAG: FAD-dependent oxidoreductase [Anaerolineae bacterium]|nr:FAD-dependent oxidoreductase [Anaerolineae bacterium]MDQ7037539.1 FAD-dependent oxidoreductase [Anaerolineae bacterium]
MRDVVVIGGGLSGLAAAYELEEHKVDYTLIEVKRQLGGSLQTIEQSGFIMDLGAFALANSFDEAWLETLGLCDALYNLSENTVAFKQGTRALIDAIAAKITAPCLMRMAVSSIGTLENGRCSICLENGMILDADALIIAVPARYAQRLFYGYITPLTEKLLDYQYDTIHRVSLGFRSNDIPPHIPNPPDMGFVFIHRSDHPSRVPDGHTLLQFGLRLARQRVDSLEQVVTMLCDKFHLPQPIAAAMGYWPEADPVSCYHDDHATWVQMVKDKLPQRVTLIGSDYSLYPPSHKGVVRLDERITQGRSAARQVLESL